MRPLPRKRALVFPDRDLAARLRGPRAPLLLVVPFPLIFLPIGLVDPHRAAKPFVLLLIETPAVLARLCFSMPDVLLPSLIVELISPRLLPTAVIAFLGRSWTTGFLFEVPLLRFLALAHVESPLRVSACDEPAHHKATQVACRGEIEPSRGRSADHPAERVTNGHHLPCGKLLPGRSETYPEPEQLRARLLLF